RSALGGRDGRRPTAIGRRPVPPTHPARASKRNPIMRHNLSTRRVALAAALALATGGAHAHDGAHAGGLRPAADKAVAADFDIVHAKIATEGNVATFHMAVS